MPDVKALIILGPPGAGKTPLGDFLAARNFFGARVFHFDFGRELRNLLRQGPEKGFDREEISRVEEVLFQSRLFEEEDEELVIKILEFFIKEKKVSPEDWIVLNGLPRHVGQVEWVSRSVDIRLVVNLVCPVEVCLKRIESGIVENRSERGDDTPETIARRYKIYLERTRPLVEFFLQQKRPLVELQVSEATAPADLWQQLVSCQSFKEAVSG